MRSKRNSKRSYLCSRWEFSQGEASEKDPRSHSLIALDFDGKDNDPSTEKANLAFRAFKHVVEEIPLFCIVGFRVVARDGE